MTANLHVRTKIKGAVCDGSGQIKASSEASCAFLNSSVRKKGGAFSSTLRLKAILTKEPPPLSPGPHSNEDVPRPGSDYKCETRAVGAIGPVSGKKRFELQSVAVI